MIWNRLGLQLTDGLQSNAGTNYILTVKQYNAIHGKPSGHIVKYLFSFCLLMPYR